MMDKKAVKGQRNYIKKQKKITVLRTVLMFALSLIIFLVGMWYFDTNKNFCTVIAILGCLPASKSAVNMIMFLRAKGGSEAAIAAITPYVGELTQLYDMYFTSYEKNYQISHMIICDNVLCGYSEDVKCDDKACEKHLETVLKQGGCGKITVKIYKDLEKYCEGIRNLSNQEISSEKLEIIRENLLSVSL